jgi:hypothetical protein
VQLDEKWSFVFKKQEQCDPDNPDDADRGDYWDHVALDAESRLVLVVVPGARDVEAVEEVVGELKQRTDRAVLQLVTSDEYPAYKTALLNAYGEEVATTATGRVSRTMSAAKTPPPGLNYATVEKRREKGRVVEIVTHVVFGTMESVQAVLSQSKAAHVGQVVADFTPRMAHKNSGVARLAL